MIAIKSILNNRRSNPAATKRARLGTSIVAGLALMSLASAQDFTNIPELRRIGNAQKTLGLSAQKRGQLWASATNTPLLQTVNGTTYVLRDMRKSRPAFIETLSLDAAKSHETNRLWPGGDLGVNLTGSGLAPVVGGIWEAGGNPFIQHAELTNKIFIQDGNFFFSDHATHVAGIMVASGANPAVRGMAFGGKLNAYDSSFDDAEATLAAAAGMRVSNHSYGAITGWVYGIRGDGLWGWLGKGSLGAKDYRFGYYDDYSKVWDDLTYAAAYYLPVVSAGNSRNGGPGTQPVEHWEFDDKFNWVKNSEVRDAQTGYDLLPGDIQNTKNSLVVAAVEELPFGYNDAKSVVMSDFSSWGPTDDGRIKPDISGTGVQVLSSVNNGYARFDGTSMAAPSVSGSLMLLVEQWRQAHPGTDMLSSTLRALAIHTAKEAGANPGPDYAFGWGMLDTAAASQVITKSKFQTTAIMERRVTSGQDLDIPLPIDGSTPIRVTIAWTDPGGTPVTPSVDNRTPMLVNDLDLRVIDNETGEEFEPWVLDPAKPADAAFIGDNKLDNVEQVNVDDPTSTSYTIRINAKNTRLSPGGSQVVSIIVSAPSVDVFGGIEFSPDEVIGGVQNSSATLNLSEVQDTDLLVQLTSSNNLAATVPTQITVPAGATQVTFPVITKSVRPVSGQSNVRVKISANSSKGSEDADIIINPITVSSMAVDKVRVAGGDTLTGTVTLNYPAPRGGAAVVLVSSQPGVSRPVRNWVNVRAGQQTASFKIRTNPVNELKEVTISGTRLGTTVSADFEIVRPSLAEFSASNGVVAAGSTVSFTVKLDTPAPKGGSFVSLSSSNKSAISVPLSVQIPEGATTATFSATAGFVSTETDVTIKAVRGSQTLELVLTVTP